MQRPPAALLPDPDLTETTLIAEAMKGWVPWARQLGTFDDADHPAHWPHIRPGPPPPKPDPTPPPFLKEISMALKNAPLHLRRSVSIRPISATGWKAMEGDRRFTHASALANYLYITRSSGSDVRGSIDYRHRDDLLAHGLALPSRHPKWATADGRIWAELDAASAGLPSDAIRAWHVVVTLPPAATPERWTAMIRRYAHDTIAAHGPAVAWAIHACSDGGETHAPPHAHLLITTRSWRHDARHGQTVANWCGSAMRHRLHADWLVHLPADMRAAATTAYCVGSFAPAHPDCSALVPLLARLNATSAHQPPIA